MSSKENNGGPGTRAAREKVSFASGDIELAAWHYPGTNGACVIMAGGFGVTKEPGTDLFAARFHEAGFTVLAFDFRRLGESGGRPRQVVRIREELDDYQAAIAFAGTLPGVDADRLAVWGFSLSGGHVFRVAARNPRLGAAIAQTPNADCQAIVRNAARHQKPLAMLRLTGRAVLDVLGQSVGRPPRLAPLNGRPGTVAFLTTPDAQQTDQALNSGNRYPAWQQDAAAGFALRLGFYRPGQDARRVQVPLLVVACDQDESALPGPAIAAASRAPRGELVRLPGGHYQPFLDGHAQAADAEVSFLRRHLVGLEPTEFETVGAAVDRPQRGRRSGN
ncbi:MAG: alpha/beta fold hydrolase [Catenulispora sp.]|nr:alpha/beta fold hydrolase [Catenulispora sp.]